MGRGGQRRSGTITDFEPMRPRYKWRMIYDLPPQPGAPPPPFPPQPPAASAPAAPPATAAPAPAPAAAAPVDAGAAEGGSAPTATEGAAGPAAATEPGAAGEAPPAAAAPEGASDAPPAAADGAAGSSAAAPAPDAANGAAATNASAYRSTIVTAPTPTGGVTLVSPEPGGGDAEWGTLSDDRTAWLCHGYRRNITASLGIPPLPASLSNAANAAGAAAAAAMPGRKRRPGVLDEQAVASALLTLNKKPKRDGPKPPAAAAGGGGGGGSETVPVVLQRQASVNDATGAGGSGALAGRGETSADGAAPAGRQSMGREVTPAGGGDGGADAAAALPPPKRPKQEHEEGAVRPGPIGALPHVGSVGHLGAGTGPGPGAGGGDDGGTGAGGPVADGAAAAAGAGADDPAAADRPVSPTASPEGLVGMEVEVERGTDGRHRGRVLSYDAKKPRLRWLVRYHDGNQEWGTFAEDLATLRVYGAVRSITWTSRPPIPKPASGRRGGGGGGGGGGSRTRTPRSSAAAGGGTPLVVPPGLTVATSDGGVVLTSGGPVISPTAAAAVGPGGLLVGPGSGGLGVGGAGLGGGHGLSRASSRRSSEVGELTDPAFGGMPPVPGGGSGGTEYRYIFRRNGMCRAQITHQGSAIIRWGAQGNAWLLS